MMEKDLIMNKIKVGLYLTNKGIKDVDLSNPEKGNPGIGGTQFNFITLPYYYNKYYNNVDFTFYAHDVKYLPNGINKVKANSATDAVIKAKKDKCDLFIYRPTQDKEGEDFLKNVKHIGINTIAWAHNTPFKHLRKISTNERIIRYVNVSKEQYDMLRDHSVIYKSEMIYNGFDGRIYEPGDNINKGLTVTFLGSLIPGKGFHVLARNWKNILKIVPEARLNVIGSGRLYSRDSALGKLGIADEKYEDLFRPFITDSNNRVLDSVRFYGVLGREKIPIMQRSLVGCVNPTGETENCPGSAIEFQACGTPVVSGAYWGLLDTVENGHTGLLGKSDQDLVDNIVYLLRNKNKAIEMGRNGIGFIKQRFNHDIISNKWHDLFTDCIENPNNKSVILPIDQNPEYEYKKFSDKMRVLKEKIFLFKAIPPYIAIRRYHRILKRLLRLLQM